MSEVKKLLAQIRMFVETSSAGLFEDSFEPLVGNDFSAQIEDAKNAELIRYLRKNSDSEQELRILNELVIALLELGEKKINYRQLQEFNAAIEDVLNQQVNSSAELAVVLYDFGRLLDNPVVFLNDVLALIESVTAMEDRLSRQMSLPCLGAWDEISMFFSGEEFLSLPEAAPSGVLKVLREEIAVPEISEPEIEEPEIAEPEIAEPEILTTTAPSETSAEIIPLEPEAKLIPIPVPTLRVREIEDQPRKVVLKG